MEYYYFALSFLYAVWWNNLTTNETMKNETKVKQWGNNKEFNSIMKAIDSSCMQSPGNNFLKRAWAHSFCEYLFHLTYQVKMIKFLIKIRTRRWKIDDLLCIPPPTKIQFFLGKKVFWSQVYIIVNTNTVYYIRESFLCETFYLRSFQTTMLLQLAEQWWTTMGMIVTPFKKVLEPSS